jgi:glycosyltransferase involved in cell wall biosynthesis
MPKLVMLLRVKDGIQFIDEWLSCFEKLVDEIVALDNGSTDGTFEVLKDHHKVVDITRTEGYNEGRDKNILYAMARRRNPDWCIWLDIDEVFEPELTRADFDRLMTKPFVNKYGFRRFHFIDDEHFAGSGDYFFFTTIHDRVMWRESPKGYFENFILDSPNVKGISGLKINTDFRLKHLGYISKELVDKKADIYRAVIDPKKESSLQRMYLHNEKKIKWYDERNHPEVKKLNAQLNLLQFKSLFSRGVKKAKKIFYSRFQNSQAQTA